MYPEQSGSAKRVPEGAALRYTPQVPGLRVFRHPPICPLKAYNINRINYSVRVIIGVPPISDYSMRMAEYIEFH